jgi:hypothetical protein
VRKEGVILEHHPDIAPIGRCRDDRCLETELNADLTLKQQHRFGLKTPGVGEYVTIAWSVHDTLVI